MKQNFHCGAISGHLKRLFFNGMKDLLKGNEKGTHHMVCPLVVSATMSVCRLSGILHGAAMERAVLQDENGAVDANYVVVRKGLLELFACL